MPPTPKPPETSTTCQTADHAPPPAPIIGRWRHGAGFLFCGTMRVARVDFDTDPSPEFQAELLDYAVWALNRGALASLDSAARAAGPFVADTLRRAKEIWPPYREAPGFPALSRKETIGSCPACLVPLLERSATCPACQCGLDWSRGGIDFVAIMLGERDPKEGR